MIVPVILAGGTGTRLWPLSRALHPKQLLNLIEDSTMLQSTMLRLRSLTGVSDPVVLCNDDHRFMVAEQFREIDIAPASIILEPVGRNTAPAVAVAALKCVNDGNDPVLLVLPADHFIEDIPIFHKALKAGDHFARKGHLITFGIVPHAPETGYGYIRKGKKITVSGGAYGAFLIDAFVEKPTLKTAKQYLESGDYCWNSGMFMFKASVVLEELEKNVPEIVNACRLSLQKGKEDLDFFRLDVESFTSCPGDSIDYAVMEKTDRGVMIPFQAGWNDLGSWKALWRAGKKDEDENVIYGDVFIHEVSNSFLHAGSRMVAAVGLKNHIVVETSDAVLISPITRVQDVKRLVEKLKLDKRQEALAHKKGYRPWGSYESIDKSDFFHIKRITIKPGARISLQKHRHRAEHWIVVKGTATVIKGDETFVLKQDESTFIPMNMKHRIENRGKKPLEIIEVQSGKHLAEDDIERLDDDYGRQHG